MSHLEGKAVNEILGYQVHSLGARKLVEEIVLHIRSSNGGAKKRTGPPAWLACLNPHSYAVAKSDVVFCEALKKAQWLIPDGAGVVLASRFLGRTLSGRVTGSDVFNMLHQELDRNGARVFFLGASASTLEKIRDRMKSDFPNIEVCGCFSPPYKSVYEESELRAMVEAVNQAAPDVLWVAMTAPKQEKWIAQNIAALDVCFVGAVGAVFDFYAGNIVRSHPAFQRLGLEWLPRLLQEPRRLWRRTFVSAPIFLLDLVVYRLFRK